MREGWRRRSHQMDKLAGSVILSDFEVRSG